METVLWALAVKSLRSLQTFWQIRFFCSNPADYRCTQGCWRVALCCAAQLLLHWSFWFVSAIALDSRQHRAWASGRERRSKCNQTAGVASLSAGQSFSKRHDGMSGIKRCSLGQIGYRRTCTIVSGTLWRSSFWLHREGGVSLHSN